jgi:hypothetical protein
MSKENIIKVYEQVDAIDREEGLVAYARYHESLYYYSRKYRIPLPRVIGAFSALSPNNDYTKNLRSLVTLLEGMRWGADVEDCTVSTYKACRWRAWQYLHGLDFLQATKGHKTRNFYRNILDPDDPEPITIDGHMACVSIGRHMTMKDVVRARFKYQVLAANFVDVAAHVGLLPNQLQAMLWFTWKRINNVIYKPQLDMFRENNQWGTLVDPSTILPFPIKTNNSSRHLTDSFEEP